MTAVIGGLGRCPNCGSQVRVSSDGLTVNHFTPWTPKVICDGSRRTPTGDGSPAHKADCLNRDSRCPATHPDYPANRCERPDGHTFDHHVTTLVTGGMQYGPVKWTTAPAHKAVSP